MLCKFKFFLALCLLGLINEIFSESLEKKIKNSLNVLGIERVVIWGHPLHSHTHSYIHYAFAKAFKHIGIPVYWTNNSFNDSELTALPFNPAKSLFITEGQVDRDLPVRNDCFYILHNCGDLKYKKLYELKHAIGLQVFTKSCESYSNLKKILPWLYLSEDTLYMPWATDLLPYEIEQNQKNLATIIQKKKKIVSFIGTIGGGKFGNTEQLTPFIVGVQQEGFEFFHKINLEADENRKVIENSMLAPAIVGHWQQEQGYIPCRIFKNISYGSLGITNSAWVAKFLGESIVFDLDSTKLAQKALKALKDQSVPKIIYDQMENVKNNHTYLNRIDALLNFLIERHSQSE